MPGPMRKNPRPTPIPAKVGGDIPSPRQKGDGNVRRLSSAGGDRDAMMRAYMVAMQNAVPQEPTFSDIPNMTPEQIAPYNKPAMDINDAFFGPDRKRLDIVEMLSNLFGGK
jgi:hypothetical protein